MRCRYTIYLITDLEDEWTRLTYTKIFYDESNRGRMSGKLYLADSFEKAVKHAQTQNIKDWVFFIEPGQILLSGFWQEFDRYIESNPDTGMLCHIMPDATCHRQNVAVNFLHLSDPKSGIATHGDGPRGYPDSIVPGDIQPKTSDQKIMAMVLGAGRLVKNWPESLRNHKLHFYPKHKIDALDYLANDLVQNTEWYDKHYEVLDSIKNVIHRHQKVLWVVNNHKPEISDSNKTVVCPASGTWWLECKCKQMLVVDTNPCQLQWAKELWAAQPTNIVRWTQDWLSRHDDVMSNWLHQSGWHTEVDSMIGTPFWDKQVKFLFEDFYHIGEHLDDCLVWASNIFTYEPNLFVHGITESKQIIDKIKRSNELIFDGNLNHGWI